MSKVVLDDVISGYGLSKINENFQKIEDELNNKVLYRDNPVDEINTIEQDLDLNGFSLYNVEKINNVAVDTFTANVDAVAGSIDSVNTVATNIANVNIVAGIDDDVTDVAAVADDVSILAPYAPDVGAYATGIYTNLASEGVGKGASLVGYRDGEDVKEALDERLPEIGTYALLRAYTGPATAFYVRGVSNIFDGGFGQFRVDAADMTSADNGGTILVDANGRRWKRYYSGDVLVDWFGRDGDAAQSAIDSLGTAGGVVSFNATVEYAVKRHVGTNDRWGLLVKYSNITLKGNRCVIRRYDSDISTYALSYPVIFVGTPDSNVASATKNVKITGFRFSGENTQHSTSGSAITDFRDAIHAKNTVGLIVDDNDFDKIDSSVIFFQKPVSYDYVNSAYYNTTTNYDAKFINNRCVAYSHLVTGRALIHAVVALGIDELDVSHNRFEWCDDCVASDSTYDYNSVRGDTYTPSAAGWSLGQVVRTGRGVKVHSNTMLNSSEHPIYLCGVDESAVGNVIRSDNILITATNDAVKIRSLGAVVSANDISGYGAGVQVAAGAQSVSVSGNKVYVPAGQATGLGAYGVSSQALSAYVAGRIAAGYWSSYRAMGGISFSGNSATFDDAAVSPANTRRHIAFSILTDTADANFPQGQIIGVTISGNSFKSHQVGVHVTGLLHRDVNINGNTFEGKPFTESGFSGATSLGTRCVLQMLRDSTDQLRHIRFANNTVHGSEYLVASFDGGGSAGTLSLPWGMNDNTFRYVKSISTADFSGVSVSTKFNGNVGVFFLDRAWGGAGIGNSLYADGGSSVNQALRFNFLYSTGAGAMRFYTDDAGTFLTL